MYLAHAGHDHTVTYTNTSISPGLIVGVVMLAIAVTAAVFFVFNMLKSRKAKSKK